MKAIRIIKEMLSGCYDIEQMGVYEAIVSTPDTFFGPGAFDQERSYEWEPEKTYLYMYAKDDDELFNEEEPDAVWMAEDGSEILLYKID